MISVTEMQICLGSSCFSRGNKDVAVFIKEYLKKHHLEDKVVFRVPAVWVTVPMARI